MDNEVSVKLDNLAFNILVKDLERYGNDPGYNQTQALLDVLIVYTLTAKGTLRGRQVMPLPTGFGKTLSIVAWITTLHQLGLDDTSVMVGAYKVEALCDIKRALIDHGVPEAKIGLIHSYEYYEGQFESPEDIPPGHASLPCTGNNEKRQIVLMTHNRVNGFGKVPLYRGKPRNLTIWDECLIKSEPHYIEVYRLFSIYGALEPYKYKPGLKSTLMDRLYEYLGKCLDIIKAEVKRLKNNDQPRHLKLPRLSEQQGEDFNRVVNKLSPLEIGNHEGLKTFIQMSLKPIRLVSAGKDTLVAFDIVFPEELNNVVVLDASYKFRELVKMDADLRGNGHVALQDKLVSYENVTVHYYKHPSGRDSLTKQFKDTPYKRVVNIEVAEVIRQIPHNQGILIFTFKTRDVDFIDVLKRDLKDSGIDPDQLLSDGKKRINFLTWGNETSLSRYSFCSNVIFVGILNRSRPDISSSILGQKDNLLHGLNKDEVNKVLWTEKLHCLYQAMCRGSCRVVSNDKASPMNVWVFDKDVSLKKSLTRIMPGLRWKVWKNTRLERKTRQQEIADKIADHLLDFRPPELTKISTSALKKKLGMTEDKVPKTTFKHGLDLFLEQTSEWALEGRSLVKQDAAYFGFTPVPGAEYVYCP